MGKIGWAGMITKFIIIACPMCTNLIEHGRDAVAAMRLGNGIAWSILLMLSVPFATIGTLAYVIWRGAKRSKEAIRE